MKDLPVWKADKVILPDSSISIDDGAKLKTWLDKRLSFRYEGDAGNITVRPGKGGWYGYKKVAGRLYSAFVASTLDVTAEKLEAVAKELIRKGEANRTTPPIKQNEFEEMRSLIGNLQNELQAVKGEITELRKNSLPCQGAA